MNRICPKCNYERRPDDLGPEFECPRCGIAYDKHDASRDSSTWPGTGSPQAFPSRTARPAQRFPYGPAVLGLAALFALLVIGVKFYEAFEARGLLDAGTAGPSHVPAITTDAFAQEVLASDGVVLVDFWAPWCGPCRTMGKTLEQVGPEYDGRLHIVKLNVDDHRSLAQRYGVRAIPTLVFFRGGKEVGRIQGALPAGQLRQRIEGVLTS